MTHPEDRFHSRKQLRSRFHDYKTSGAYFVILCTNKGICLFGNTVDGKVVLNDAGKLINNEWLVIPERFSSVDIDFYVVMPNHFHAIVMLGMELIKGEWTRINNAINPDLSHVIGAFKSITTVRYSESVRRKGWDSFDQKLWQRSFFERVIRSDEELNRIRQYIELNPLKWHLDRENPARIGIDDFDRWIDELSVESTKKIDNLLRRK